MPSLQLDQLDPESRTLVGETMTILDGWWDEQAGLLRQTSGPYAAKIAIE